MLFAHNGGGLKLAAAALLCAGLVACSTETPSNNPGPAASNASQASDLRTHLDLLMSEQVMIVAKETSAAVNHSDAYAGYTTLLSANSADLSALIGRAFGDTAAGQFAQQWNGQNGYLVDYAIAVVTHDDARAKTALAGLTTTFAPQFAQMLSDTSRLPLDPVTQLITQQVLEDRVFINDVAAQKFSAFYKDLHTAYAQSFRLGDALAAQMVQRFPDKFPGEISTPNVDTRVSINALLQEHAYLVTMGTEAVVADRTGEASAASSALVDNGSALTAAMSNTQLANVWTARNTSLFGYAQGNVQGNPLVTGKFVSDFVSVTHANKTVVQAQVTATLRVIDEQRARSSKTIAGDDRAAATAMQPVADSLHG